MLISLSSTVAPGFLFAGQMYSNTPKVLLIDDNAHGLVVRRAVLEQSGYRVEVANGGAEGVAMFEAGGFDVVVTDYRMPDLLGTQVLAQVRKQNPRVPVVILSGFALKLGLTEEQTGADAVLMKGPQEGGDLVRAVGRLLRRKPRSARPATERRRWRRGA